MNEAEFDAVYAAEWPGLVRQLTVVCGDRSEAADCVQEAFVKAWEHRRRLDADAGGWVRTAALRLAVSRWRKARNAMTAWKRDHARSASTPGTQEPELTDWDGPAWQALRRLPSSQREAVVMHHVLDLSVAEISQLVGSPEGTVKARLSRGRSALALGLTAASPGPADTGRPDLPFAPRPTPEGSR